MPDPGQLSAPLLCTGPTPPSWRPCSGVLQGSRAHRGLCSWGGSPRGQSSLEERTWALGDFAALCDLSLVSADLSFQSHLGRGAVGCVQVAGRAVSEGLPGPGVKLGQLKETRPGRCEEESLGPHFSTSQRPSGRAPKETPATEPHPLPRGPAPGREVPPRAGPPPRAHPSPRPGSRRPAGQSWAAQVEF